MLVKINWLKNKISETLADFPIDQIEIVADALLWAEMTGKKTQGIIKLTGTEPLQNIKPKDKIIFKIKKCSVNIEGNANPAPVSTLLGMEKAIDLAKEHGVGIAGINGIYSSNTTQSYYLYKIAKQGYIGFMCSRSPAVQTGFNSIDPLFGTNPIGISLPSTIEPLFFDFATSAITWYGLVLAQIKGEALPNNIAIDKNGNITSNPNDAMEGAILPYSNDHRSSSIALMVEMLAGPLVGAAFVDMSLKTDWGSFIFVIDPEIMCGTEKFKEATTETIRKIKSSRAAFGKKVNLPSETSLSLYKEALRTGSVDIDEKLLKHLNYI